MPAATKPAPHPLDTFFSPSSIALIGASRDLEKIPGRLLSMLRKNHYPGRIYPINPNYGDIDGLKCYPSNRRRRAADRSRHRHHSRARGARRTRAMRRRRRQERGDHLVGFCRGGRRQHRDAGCHRGAGQKDRHADFRSQCGRFLQRSPARRGDLQPHGRRQAGRGGPRRDQAPRRHRRAERRHRLCHKTPRQGAGHCDQLLRQRRQRSAISAPANSSITWCRIPPPT